MNATLVRRNVGKVFAVLAIASLMMIPASSVTAKQEPIVSGAWLETLGSMAQADSHSSLVLARVTLEPGARLRAHDHPGTAVITVESGVLETELLRGSGTIYRSAADAIEPVFAESGAKVTLQQGDAIAFEQDCGKTMANAGDEPLVMTLSLVAADGQPIFSFDTPPRSFNPTLQ